MFLSAWFSNVTPGLPSLPQANLWDLWSRFLQSRCSLFCRTHTVNNNFGFLETTYAFGALTLLVWRQEEHLACRTIE